MTTTGSEMCTDHFPVKSPSSSAAHRYSDGGWMAFLLQTNSVEAKFILSNGNFPGRPGLASTRMSPFWILLELRMMEVVSGDNWHTKLQSNRHTQQTNTQLFLQAGCPSCRPTTSVRALKEYSKKQSLLCYDNSQSSSGLGQIATAAHLSRHRRTIV